MKGKDIHWKNIFLILGFVCWIISRLVDDLPLSLVIIFLGVFFAAVGYYLYRKEKGS